MGICKRKTLWAVLAVAAACDGEGHQSIDESIEIVSKQQPLTMAESVLRIWRHSDGVWYEKHDLGAGGMVLTPWGTAGDIPVRMDTTGDGKRELVVFRQSEGRWYVRGGTSTAWGTMGDVPVPGDYDGDNKDDLAVWRPGNGTWYVMRSSDGAQIATAYGVPGDIPVPGDYDGDGKTDLAVWRPAEGRWYTRQSSNGVDTQHHWGQAGDAVAQADYDGDGKTDRAVFRPGSAGGQSVWFVVRSSNGSTFSKAWGTAGDIVVPLDYDRDGRADIAVWRPSDGVWYILKSSNGASHVSAWGTAGDVPVGYTSVSFASPEVLPPPPMPTPPPPPPPPPPAPTKGQVSAKLYLDTSAGTISCGMTSFVLTKSESQPGQTVHSMGYFVAEGSKPGLKRCRWDARWWNVDPGAWTVCARVGGRICRNTNVTAGGTANVTLEF